MDRFSFEKVGQRYDVYNNQKERVGIVHYLDEWKTWVWRQEVAVVMAEDCMREVLSFIHRRNLV